MYDVRLAPGQQLKLLDAGAMLQGLHSDCKASNIRDIRNSVRELGTNSDPCIQYHVRCQNSSGSMQGACTFGSCGHNACWRNWLEAARAEKRLHLQQFALLEACTYVHCTAHRLKEHC